MAATPEDGTVAIVGKGLHRVEVPWGEDGYEFWGLNDPDPNGWAPLECYHRWFQLHGPSYMAVHYPDGLPALSEHWGESRGIPLYMDQHYPAYPDSTPYPMEKLASTFPFGGYHTSSFDYMVALAVLEGWSRIELYGCDFYTFPTMLSGEPLSARATLEFWLGVAAGRGTEIVVHGRGDVFKNIHCAVYRSDLMYGLEREPALDLGLTDAKWSDVR